jgi:hypothetical protein
MSCTYKISSSPAPQVLTHTTALAHVEISTGDGRVVSQPITIQTQDGSAITDEFKDTYLNKVACEFDEIEQAPLPTLNWVLDTPIQVVHNQNP